MNVSGMFRSMLGEAKAGEAKPLELKTGQVVRGVVQQLVSEQEAVLSINGVQVRARLETPLAMGQATMLQVQPMAEDGQIVLKPLDASSVPIADSSLKEVLKSLDLPDTPDTRQLVQLLHQSGIALTKDNVQAFAAVRSAVPAHISPEQWLGAAVIAFHKGLPLNSETVASIQRAVQGQPLHEMLGELAEAAVRALERQPQLSPQSRGWLEQLRVIIQQVKQASAALTPADGGRAPGGPAGGLAGSSAGSPAGLPLMQAPGQFAAGASPAGGPASPTTGAPGAAALPASAAGPQAGAMGPAASPAPVAGLPALAQGPTHPAGAPLAPTPGGTPASAMAVPAAGTPGSASPQPPVPAHPAGAPLAPTPGGTPASAMAVPAAVSPGSASPQPPVPAHPAGATLAPTPGGTPSGAMAVPAAGTPGVASPAPAPVPAHPAGAPFAPTPGGTPAGAMPARTPDSPANALLAPASPAAVLGQRGEAAGTSTAHAGASPANAQPAPADAHWIGQIFKALGLDHESGLLKQWGRSDVGSTPHLAAAHSEGAEQARLADSLKSVLLQLAAAEDVPESFKEAAKQAVQHITGQQLLLSSDRSAPFSHITLFVPLQGPDGEQTASIHIQSRKSGNGALDPDNCRLVFDLRMKSLGNTMVDVQVVDRIVSLHVRNDLPFLQELLDSHREEIANGMASIGYQFISMKYSAYPVPTSEASSSSDILRTPRMEAAEGTGYIPKRYKGVDYRI